jgi:hypothetical protein
MIPNNVLSTTPAPAPVTGARARAVSNTVDFEDGGIALQDPSQGSQYQQWRGRLLGEDVVLDAPTVAPVTIYSAPNITEISFTFSQNMDPALAFVQAGMAKLFWFDSVVGSNVVTEFPDAVTPRVILDDKRFTQTTNSDIIFAYLRSGALYYRQQRDRFQVERLLDAGPYAGLVKIGFNSQLRLQFFLLPV